MRKHFFVIMAMVLFVGMLSFSHMGIVMAGGWTKEKLQSENEELTAEEIQQRLEEINNKYEIGEEFSKEDEDFVKKYANNKISEPGDFKPFKVYTFYGERTHSGIRAVVEGYADINMGAFDGSYYVEVYTSIRQGSTYVNQIRNEVRHTVYGLVGSGGFGKIYDRTHSVTCNSKSYCNMVVDQTYGGIAPVYAHTAVKATIYHNNGSFDVTPDNIIS